MKSIKSIISLLIVIFIPFGLFLWIRIHQTTGFTTKEMIMYPFLFGSLSIFIICLLKVYFLNENLSDFNSGQGKLSTDFLWGCGLTLVYFILFFVESATLTKVLSFKSNQELLGLILDMRDNVWLLLLFFGPVLWIGVALFEELVRIFMLSILWQYSKSQFWIFAVIVFSALIMGFAHWNQGSFGIVTIAIQSLIAGFFFFKFRRLLPLILAHVLYDGIQVTLLLITYPH